MKRNGAWFFVSVATATIAILCITAQEQQPSAQPQSSESANHLSPAFLRSATSALVAIHECKQNVARVVSKNLPRGFYDPNLAARAFGQVEQTKIDASTDGDHQAATLLNSYVTKVKTWAERHKADRDAMNASRTMGEDPLAQDSDWQAIESCENGLKTMLSHRVFDEIAGCR